MERRLVHSFSFVLIALMVTYSAETTADGRNTQQQSK